MNSKAREARREYKRNWQRKNRDKCRAQQERYWTKRAEREAQKAHDTNEVQEAGRKTSPQTMPA